MEKVENKKLVVELHAQGLRTKVIAEKCGLSIYSVQYIIRMHKAAIQFGIEINAEPIIKSSKIFGIF